MNTNLKLFGGVLALVLTATSCVNDGFGREDWSIPNIACNNKFNEPTISLADFVKQAPASGSQVLTEEQIIEGYVISSDENGNFYKSIVFQDKAEDPTVGLQIEVDKGFNYIGFPVGAKIRISTKGLVLGTDRGVVKLGSVDRTYAIGRIPESKISNYIAMVCADGKSVVEKIVPKELTDLSQARNAKYVNQLVSVSNVQFADEEILGVGGTKTYVEQSPKADTNRNLIDNNGNTTILRTAAYASYGADLLPEGNGKITFVLSKYNNTYQALIRSKKDIDFSGERADVAKAKGGTALTYLKAGDTEDFNSYATGAASEAFPKYLNDPVIGDRYWRVASFGNNKYIQFGYSATGAKPYARTFFAVPVDFDQMNTFSFKSKDGYNTNKSVSVLKVYYSTDYKANATNPTLVDITNVFTISNLAEANRYAANFTDSGNWTKPATLTGKGFIIFEYQGGGSLPTTTMQIDDLQVN